MNVQMNSSFMAQTYKAENSADILKNISNLSADDKTWRAVDNAWKRLNNGEQGFAKIILGTKYTFYKI